MEKFLLDNKNDLKKAIEHFGEENEIEVLTMIKSYPCVLIGQYCEDWEFGNAYTFAVVDIEDFHK